MTCILDAESFKLNVYKLKFLIARKMEIHLTCAYFYLESVQMSYLSLSKKKGVNVPVVS